MHHILNDDELALVVNAWRSIFDRNDPFEWCFRRLQPPGRLFFPTDWYRLTQIQYDAIVASAQAIGSSDVGLLVVEVSDIPTQISRLSEYDCAICGKLVGYEQYHKLTRNILLENVMFDFDGRWALAISHEETAMIAGTAEFTASLDEHYPNFSVDQQNFRDAFTTANGPSMVHRFLTAIAGK